MTLELKILFYCISTHEYQTQTVTISKARQEIKPKQHHEIMKPSLTMAIGNLRKLEGEEIGKIFEIFANYFPFYF
jgi:hypothetical protein